MHASVQLHAIAHDSGKCKVKNLDPVPRQKNKILDLIATEALAVSSPAQTTVLLYQVHTDSEQILW